MKNKSLNITLLIGLIFTLSYLFSGWQEHMGSPKSVSKYENIDFQELPDSITHEDLIKAAASGYDYEYLKRLAQKRMKAPQWNKKPTSRKAKKVAMAKKKKKKKKKKKDKKKENKKKAADTEASEPKSKSKKKFIDDSTSYTITNNIPTPATEEESDLQGLSEWVLRFAEFPSKKTRDEFIASYLNGEVTKDLYFAVVNELLIFPQEILPIIAVQLLDLLPSQQSFLKLVELSTENESSIIVELANKSVSKYNTLAQVNYLRQVIASSRAEVPVNRAIDLLEYIAINFGKNSRNQGSVTNGDEVNTLQVTVSNVRQFENLIPAVERAMSAFEDSSIVSRLDNLVVMLEDTIQRFAPYLPTEQIAGNADRETSVRETSVSSAF